MQSFYSSGSRIVSEVLRWDYPKEVLIADKLCCHSKLGFGGAYFMAQKKEKWVFYDDSYFSRTP